MDYQQPRHRRVTRGYRKAHQLRLVREVLVGGRSIPTATPIRSPRDVYAFMEQFAAQEVTETFWLLALNAQHEVTAPIVVTRGTVTQTLVHPREVFRVAIVAGAVAIVGPQRSQHRAQLH